MIHWDKIYICTVRKYKGFNDFFLYSHEIIDIWLKWQTDEAENFLVTEAESSMVISVSSAPDTEHCQYPCTILSTLVPSSVPITPLMAAIPPMVQMKRWLTPCRQRKTRFHKLENLILLFFSSFVSKFILWTMRTKMHNKKGSW